MLALREHDYRLLSGRLRIAIPGLRKNTLLAKQLVQHLNNVPGVKASSANPLTGRALIYFDQAII
ncbi:MAG TPA: cation-transporting P-type ATPase, partial [Firmicutes bacterium]|nr:cation-transporting P-type ATPase [Bacillota bacterium]